MGILSNLLGNFTRKVYRNPLNRDGDMGFLDHLEELRKRIIRAVFGILTGVILAITQDDFIVDGIIFAPAKNNFITYDILCRISHSVYGNDSMCFQGIDQKMQNLSVAGQFTSYIFIMLVSGIILSFPWIIQQFWLFVKPALNQGELKNARGFVLATTLLFMLGIGFGFFVLTPTSISFLSSFSLSQQVENIWNFQDYLSFVITINLACGLVFELPVLVYFLTRIGLLGSAFMKKNRRYAVVIILIVAAILTPSPDITSQLLMALPLYILYEFSIFVAMQVERNATNRSSN